MFSKILIANRGEIAVRIIRACKEMGISTVAVYSEADRDNLHTALADEAVCIGPAASKDSYLCIPAIISAALVTGAQAIHPGYGFLSESEEFATACRKNNIVFIGPDVDCMRKISDKTKIKEIFSDTALRPIPGTGVLSDVYEAVAAAENMGYPVMLKARSGGGGRGIRMVSSTDEMYSIYPLAFSESQAAFGDGAIYMEKYIHPARHIEVQVLADEAGNVVCLGERECSVQRHHQKLIEESPSPGISEEKRRELIENVIEAVKKIDYTGVGTLEFLMDKSGNLWFMEMNVRLQVEHTVSEMLTKYDLVKWQIRTAAGVLLSFSQKEIPLRGTAIECRINALAPGKLGMLHIPGGPFVRFDTYLVQGVEISPFYDSLIGKLIVFASTREEALRKMKAALCELVIEGIKTNIEEQLQIISDPRFSSGEYDLTLMESM